MTEQKKLAEKGARKAYFNRYMKAGIHTIPGFQGAPAKDKPQVIFGWELVEDFTDEETPRPMWTKPFGVGNVADFTNDKSNQWKYMTGMFLEFDPENDNPADYLGRGCRVLIKHGTSNNPKYAGIFFDNFAGCRDYDGELPPISQPPVFFDFYNPTKESLENVFPWEIEFMQEAVDYPGSKLEELITNANSNVVRIKEADDEHPDF